MAANAVGSQPPKLDSISRPYVVFLGVTAMMTFISTICVGLRFASKRLAVFISWDDWACLGSLVFAYGFLVSTALSATVGHAGYHAWEYDTETLVRFSQIQLATNVIYAASIALSKISILLFYRRLFFIVDSFCICTWAVGFLVVASFLSTTFAIIFGFSPVEAQWNFWVPHTTIDRKQYWLAGAIVNLLLDVLVLSLPQARVWKLKQTMRRKISLSVVFMMGGLVCIASILRIASIQPMDLNDLTYAFTVPEIWSLVEMDLSIICACLPIFPNLFRYWYDGTLPNTPSNSVSLKPFRPSLKDRLRLKRPVVGTGYSDLEVNGACDGSEERSSNVRQSSHKDLGSEERQHHCLKGLEPVHVYKDIEVWESAGRSTKDGFAGTEETLRNSDVARAG